MINLTACGRLAFDAEQSADMHGGTKLTFRLPVETKRDDKESTVWLKCTIFGKRAEALANHLTKGQQVTVVGRYQRRVWEGKVQDEVTVSEVHIHWPARSGERPAGRGPATDEIPF